MHKINTDRFDEMDHRAHALSDAFRDLACECAANGDIYGCHYAVTQMNAISRLAQNTRRRFGK